ncbi:SusC/RagA family TonB-linked outer membrane protein [Chryseolinea lacunae]|uniref:TonB-dependent receptor n=1 Tax=Chryseolinea lacunae TaxID=2801331 RepID=A0ABS1L1Q4_9BACT|nr:TonB-dependent receptor [Chryseolinea lacunae]MBL0744456.1 TonB-dependent receptor [Chryseolinea lacunae]
MTKTLPRILFAMPSLITLVVLLQLFAVWDVQGQATAGRQISGRVTDAKSEPIPGVSIYEKGTTTGTLSDGEGNFQLQVSPEAVIVFSSIGFITKEIPLGTQSTLNISLTEDIQALDEVVVVGYGEQKRSNVIGAVASVNVKDMENKSVLRLDQALQGMTAGVTVARNGGAPGAAPTVHIRGVGSINNTDPLWIVDGIRMDPGNQFDVDDVESIEILKDAAASAIYGARAANGVILVTTKRGKGNLQVNFKTSIGKRSPVKLPTLLNSADFVKYRKEGRLNAGQNPDPSWDNYSSDTDWVNAFYAGSGVLRTYDLSVSKGDDKSNFYLGFGHDTEDGILIDNNYKRYSMRLNSDMHLTKWLKLGESILLSRVIENPIGNNDENSAGGIPYRSIPIMPIYDDTNPYGGWGRGPVYFQGPNPVATQYQQHEKRTYSRLDGNVYLEATPVKGLVIRGTVGYNYYNMLGEKFNEAFDYGSLSNPIAQLTYSSGNDQTITANGYATYTRSFNKHSVKVMGGYEASQWDSRHFNVVGNNFPIDVASSLNLATGAISTTDKQNVNQTRLLSQFGRFDYNFDEKYLLEANIRRDASAPKFGPSNLWGVFPSVSAGWRISQESFFRNVPYITNLKLRASTGKLGSENIGSWIYLKTYTSQFSTYAFNTSGSNKVTGFFISKYPNGEVHWEEAYMHNVALDIKAFKNKVSLSVDYYIKDSKSLLYPVPIPPSVGIAVHNFDPVNPEVNIGTMRNRGIDIDFGYTTTVQKFDLTFNGNTSFLKNELTKLNGDDAITAGSAGGQIGGMSRTQVGKPVGSFYGYQVQQVLNSANDVYAVNSWAPDGIYQEAGTAPGDFMYRDLSGANGVPDGDVTADFDRTIIGNPWPKMTYALNIGAVYNKLIDVNLQFQGVQGVDVFNASKAYTRNFFGDNNTTTAIHDAWTPENHTGNPRNISSDPNGNWGKPSSYFVENGSYLKLRNIQIGLNVPQRLLQKWHITRLRVYANANNVLTFTKYSGLDPEVAGTNVSRGVDFGNYPQVRSFTGGLELQF